MPKRHAFFRLHASGMPARCHHPVICPSDSSGVTRIFETTDRKSDPEHRVSWMRAARAARGEWSLNHGMVNLYLMSSMLPCISDSPSRTNVLIIIFLMVAPRRRDVCNVSQHEWWAVGSTRVASTRGVPWSMQISPSLLPSLARPCQDHEELIDTFLLSRVPSSVARHERGVVRHRRRRRRRQ